MLTPPHRGPAVFCIASVMLAAAVQLWLVSGGMWRRFPQPGNETNYDYSRMAEGFLHGQLSLRIEPSPALLALPDPYDPRADAPYALRDAALFNGRYYYYWGPVPAIFLAAVCRIMGISQPRVGDQYVGFPFLLGVSAVASALILRIGRKFFPRQPPGAAPAALLSLALGMPMLYGAADLSGNVTAILSGQFFLLAGLLAAWRATDQDAPSRGGLMAIAGTCWALSAGSRLSLPPALAAIAAITLWHLWRRSRSGHAPPPLAETAGLLIPMLAGAALLGWYNLARFHSVIEFGLRYQLAGRNQTDLFANGFFSAGNVIPNLFLYLLQPPARWHTFPYLVAVGGRPLLRRFLAISPYAVCAPLVGLAWTQPFLIFTPMGLIVRRRAAGWLSACLCMGVVLGIAPALTMDSAYMRYLLDAVPCATILAAIGYFGTIERLGSGAAKAAGALAWLLIAAQSVAGLLLAMSYCPAIFKGAMIWWPKI